MAGNSISTQEMLFPANCVKTSTAGKKVKLCYSLENFLKQNGRWHNNFAL